MIMPPEWYETVMPYLYLDKNFEVYKKYGEMSIREDAPPEAKEMYEEYMSLRRRGLK